ncbi:hypothetical protein N7532_000352 [Penicillium argentinense]|uniref:TUG ubiquitin-like domain-containing protein n=1 Tax=Penicillium argentinense TaxID=1131581 RepID=A0A9W9KNS1_9EURO|nr:uncharacterized protein N7532_000352 [Penicillium argentinense]KAJ5112307.1 hypothetical protein N7532_000352 [Penicillium argentinense]
MSAHVVVIDATARRATIKTTPSTHLTDVLQEACKKLGYNASQYGLKHNRKQLDLSLTFRLTGLKSGAKLELVQQSRSPSVVTIALQLPESEARGAPNGRILDKFPSTTTLWLVLRKFEAGVAGSNSVRNLTARGAPDLSAGGGGSARLFYEIPVLQVLDRELSSFTDLQKSLAQLGFNSGNILIRLSFRRTEEPLEEAMVKIGEYFKSAGEDTAPPTQNQASAPIEGKTEEQTQTPSSSGQPEASNEMAPQPPADHETLPDAPQEQPASASSSGRPVTVFSPPSTSTPSSAQIPHNEEDYIPSVEHAKAHQRQLNQSSRNQRLPTDAEIEAKAAAEEKRRAEVREVDVKVRFPDQSQVVSKFGPADSGLSLYGFVRSCLDPAFAKEKIILNVFVNPALGRSGHATTIPESDRLLIKDLGLSGRVLVNFTWTDAASAAAQQGRSSILRPELRDQARELKIEQPRDIVDEPAAPASSSKDAGHSGSGEPTKSAGLKKSGGVPKWLKLPGKK